MFVKHKIYICYTYILLISTGKKVIVPSGELLTYAFIAIRILYKLYIKYLNNSNAEATTKSKFWEENLINLNFHDKSKQYYKITTRIYSYQIYQITLKVAINLQHHHQPHSLLNASAVTFNCKKLEKISIPIC